MNEIKQYHCADTMVKIIEFHVTFFYVIGSTLPDQLASLHAMSPGATSPTLGATPTVNNLAQSTHGMEQLAQASLQSARLATQNPLYNTINFDANNMNLNGNGLPGYTPVDINSPEAANPEVIQAIRSQGIPLVKQEKDNSHASHTVNPSTIHQNDATNPPRGMIQ